MFSSSALLSLLLVAVSFTDARISPVRAVHQRTSITNTLLKVASQLSLAGNQTLVDLDRVRVKQLYINTNGGGHKRATTSSANNNGVTFTASVGVGSPATQYTLLIDTGSSNTWIGANNSATYKPTSTSNETSEMITLSTGSGQMSGDTYTDQVTLGLGLVIQKQFIGVSTQSQGFDGIDGLLGLGPADLTKGTLTDENKTVATVMDNLYQQKTIPAEILGMYYAPSSTGLPVGELSFGSVDVLKTNGTVNYVPITSDAYASKYWGIDQSISYNGVQILKSSAGMVDSGTTMILVSTDAFAAYEKATGGKLDSKTGMLKITAAQFSALKNLDFQIGNQTYSLVPDAQIWPRALNSKIGGAKDDIYLVVQSFGSNEGVGFEFINGFAFLQRFYSVYDTTNKQVGFAPTAATNAKSNY